MKLFHLLKNRNGKMTLSTAQTIGLAAVVGVAGVGAWQMLSSSKDVNPDTMFSAASEPEIVYVTGGSPAGEYTGYGEGGAVISTSSYAKKARGMELGFETFEGGPAAYAQRPDLDSQEDSIQAYKMDGQFEGLSAGNEAVEQRAATGDDLNGLGNGADMQAQIADIVAQAKQQAASAGAPADVLNAGEQAAVQSEAAAAIRGSLGEGGSGSGKWGMAEGMARANGHNLNATPLQAPTAGSLRSGTLNGTDGQSASGATTRADVVGVSPKFEGGRGSVIEAGRRFRGNNSLEGLRKDSADVAANRKRSANEGSRGFFAAEQQSGGLRLTGTSSALETDGNSSNDYMDTVRPNLSGLTGAMTEYFEDKANLNNELEEFTKFANKWSWWSLLIQPASLRAGVVYLAVSKRYNAMKDTIDQFEEKYEKNVDEEYRENTYGSKTMGLTKQIYGRLILPGWPKATYEKTTQQWAEEGKEEESVSKSKNSQDANKNGNRRGGNSKNSPYGRNAGKDSLKLK